MDQNWKPKQEVLGAISDRQVAGLRLFLSAIGLIALYIDPSEPSYFAMDAYSALILYTFYSAGIYLITRRTETLSRRDNTLLVWADLFLYSLLISLSGGTNSLFFWFYFFAILVACSRLGARTGLKVILVATAIFLAQAWFSKPSEVQWNKLLTRPASLCALGYILIYWASAEQRLRRKLELLRQVSLTSNPRFGVDHTANELMRRVLEFFKADACVVLERELQTDDYFLRQASANPDDEKRSLTLTDDIRPALPEIGRAGVVLCNGHGKGWTRFCNCRTWNPASQMAGSRPMKEALTLSKWLDCRSFISVPLRHHEWHRGYLFVSAVRANAFRLDDAKFLLQLADQVTPVLEHIRLVDHMASDAAENERRRIARSVHDRVIQPYIGLQMGLMGVSRAVNKVLKPADPTTASPESQRVLASLESVVDMARQGVEELRQYVTDLRQTKTRGDVLLDSLLRYAAKFETVTGIQVSVTGDRIDSWTISDRLAGEIFQMATEALSNVHRHTTATAVSLSIERNSEGKITVRIENEIPESASQLNFFPQSIAERAIALGGRIEVSCSEGRTVVRIEIPL